MRYGHFDDRNREYVITRPDPELNSTLNTWGIYNALVTFNWSRTASLIYTGIDRDGFGYRDTLPDIMGIVHAFPPSGNPLPPPGSSGENACTSRSATQKALSTGSKRSGLGTTSSMARLFPLNYYLHPLKLKWCSDERGLALPCSNQKLCI